MLEQVINSGINTPKSKIEGKPHLQ